VPQCNICCPRKSQRKIYGGEEPSTKRQAVWRGITIETSRTDGYVAKLCHIAELVHVSGYALAEN
jgi:hypothetical protein